MKNIKTLFLSMLLIVVTGISGAAQDTSKVGVTPSEKTLAGAEPQNERYRIGFQDVIDVQVYRHPELTQRVPVSQNGTISLFRLEKPVTAICRTESELAKDIEDAYREKYLRDPQVKVMAEQKSQPIGVMGAVEKPGNFFINRRTHLLEMLALAGGPKEEAGTRLIVARAGNNSACKDVAATDDDVAFMGFKVRDVQEGRQVLWMKPGDVISVLKADMVYVYGNVNKQGAYEVREPITLTQAIVTAEGFKSAAKRDKVRILRQRDGRSEREELVFNMDHIDKGKVKDPILEPNDIVAVSQDNMKAILNGIGSTLKGAVPNAAYRFP